MTMGGDIDAGDCDAGTVCTHQTTGLAANLPI